MWYKGYEVWMDECEDKMYYTIWYDRDEVVFESEEDVKLFIDCVG